jgi:hypothetical protein
VAGVIAEEVVVVTVIGAGAEAEIGVVMAVIVVVVVVVIAEVASDVDTLQWLTPTALALARVRTPRALTLVPGAVKPLLLGGDRYTCLSLVQT